MEDVLVIDRANVPDAAVTALARQFTVHEAAPDAVTPTTHLGGKQAGIVGLGFIGRQIARRAEAFGMTVSYADIAPVADVPYAYVDSAERLASEVDVLFVSCRGGRESDGLIDARVLEALGPAGYLVHIAQARFYNERDLVAALKEGNIAGAAIDIFPDEPRVHPALPALDNVILSSHVGAITNEILARRAELVATNLRQLLDGDDFAARLV